MPREVSEGRVGKGIESRAEQRRSLGGVEKQGAVRELPSVRFGSSTAWRMRPVGRGPSQGPVSQERERAPVPQPGGTHPGCVWGGAGRGGPGAVRWGACSAGPPRTGTVAPPPAASHGPSCPRCCWQRFKSEDAPKIHVALSLSLFLLNLTFFFNMGYGPQLSGATCRARGAVFHYFLLCTFTWMGLEAFHLYLLVIKVFNTYFGHYFLKLSSVGWGRCSSGGRGTWPGLGGVGGRTV